MLAVHVCGPRWARPPLARGWHRGASRVCRCYFSRAPLACMVSFLRSLFFIVFLCDYKNERCRRYCLLGSCLVLFRTISWGPTGWLGCIIMALLNAVIEYGFCLVNALFMSSFCSVRLRLTTLIIIIVELNDEKINIR